MDAATLKTDAQFKSAAEAVSNSGLCVGILCEGGAVLAATCSIKSQYPDGLEIKEKIHQLHPTVACAVAGCDADAKVLRNRLKKQMSKYIYNNHNSLPCKQIVQAARDPNSSPLAVSILLVGWNEDDGYQLILSEPNGTVGAWKMKAIGRYAATANQLLMDKIGDKKLSLEKAKYVALEVLSNNIGVQFLTANKVEMATFQSVGGHRKIKIHSYKDVKEACEKFKREYEEDIIIISD